MSKDQVCKSSPFSILTSQKNYPHFSGWKMTKLFSVLSQTA